MSKWDTPPSELERERIVDVIEILAGCLEYDGIKKWLSIYDTLDEAWEAANILREGMIAT